MDIRELKNRTRVYEYEVAKAIPIEWPCGKIMLAYRARNGQWSLSEKEGYTLIGYIHPFDEYGYKQASDLPIEFYNHQLFKYDPASEGSVREFVEEWGFPFLPTRNLSLATTRTFDDYESRIDAAYRATNSVKDLALILSTKYISDEDYIDYLREYGEEDEWLDQPSPSYGDSIPEGDEADALRNMLVPTMDLQDAISVEEASLTLELLQRTVTMFKQAIVEDENPHGFIQDVINLGASSPYIIRGMKGYTSTETTLSSYSLLTSAICNQIIDSIADPAPWRECACMGCGRIFKRKQGKALSPSYDSIYCCSTCEERQKKRNQRAAAKARAAH